MHKDSNSFTIRRDDITSKRDIRDKHYSIVYLRYIPFVYNVFDCCHLLFATFLGISSSTSDCNCSECKCQWKHLSTPFLEITFA